ncbi:putative multiple sugar transport system permease protein [Austwickia chelonae]|uniref:Xylose transport system permease protein XylH n=1 Tax=Austwickia chelonae NBRC 105200 TaxID=1184607 RepID=K6VMJ0_9MICO|nr:multiple monosaccharide ABC transporter permease [Austwickia chelonae]GAB76575.1 putative sugar ABC transporter permease protein [Austwickia chelonae NBRC 105200]SEW27189.1 putative multiple sugar transport system permease protein [Austwickia chelonae]
MELIRKVVGGDLRQFGMIFALAVILVFFQFRTGGLMLTPDNLISVVSQYSYILILAIGMVMVIIAGHIDLSVGSVAAFVGIIVAKLMQNGTPSWVAFLIGLLIGAAVGAWQGYWVAYWGVPAFIVTLAGMMIFRGANQWVGNSQSVPVPEDFQYIGAGFLPELHTGLPYNEPTLIIGLLATAYVVWHELHDRRIRVKMKATVVPMIVTMLRIVLLSAVLVSATLLFASGRPGTSFPVSGLVLVALVLLYSFVTGRTVFGRHVYAVGGNLRAATLAGVKTQRTNFFVMMNMSVLAALAGMIFVARSTASGPQDGNSWELDAIAAVFIGGAAVTGGVGTVIGSIVGGLVMAFLNTGLALEGIGSDRVQIIKGLVLLFAVAIDVWNKKQGKPSIIGHFLKSRNDNGVPRVSPTTGADATQP